MPSDWPYPDLVTSRRSSDPISISGGFHVAALPWSEPVPGLRMKVLYKDNQAQQAMMLVEAGPGSVIPEHVHGDVEWALVLEGTMEDEEGVVSAGNFVYRPPAADTRCECLTEQNILVSFMDLPA